MSAVAEAPVAEQNPRSRLALLQRTLGERRAERDKILADIARTGRQEADEVARAIRAAPTRRVFGLRSPAQLLQAKREKLVAKLPNLDREIAELEVVAGEAQAAAAGAELEEKARHAASLETEEREALAELAEVFETLVAVHARLVELAEAKDQLYLVATRSPLWTSLPEEERTRLERSTWPLLQPFPGSVGRLVADLMDVCVGADQTVWRRDPGPVRPAGRRVLLEATRDLTAIARSPSFSGRIERT